MALIEDSNETIHKVINGDCAALLSSLNEEISLTFLDPPFNQQKDYALHDDNLPEEKYWQMMREVCSQVFHITKDGGAIYFMQREKNTERVLRVLHETGWELQNLIIWKKLTSAVPSQIRYGKSYQVIAFATKGNRPRVFNRLRINPPLLKNQKYERENGCFVTDVWDDIRELTSGYFAGDEALRNEDSTRFHKQQSPIALLLRIILSVTSVGDTVLDPFAGSGTTAVVAKQLGRNSISIEIDSKNCDAIENRLNDIRKADSIEKYRTDYIYMEGLNEIWGKPSIASLPKVKPKDLDYKSKIISIA
jgi:DNA modification methylase